MKTADEQMVKILSKFEDIPIKEQICNMIDRYNDMKGCQSEKTNFGRMWKDLDGIVEKMEQDGY